MTAAAPCSNNGIYWVVSSTESSNAGYRIRTQPLIKALAARGLSARVITSSDLQARFLDFAGGARIVIMAKPSDTSGYLCLRALLDRHVFVCIDLFDNYFSWSPALARRHVHWQWLRNLNAASLAITSTAYLDSVVQTLRSGPSVRIPDPLPTVTHDAEDHVAMTGKWPLKSCVEVLWFGIASNPYFQAGLSDLADWQPVLRRLQDRLASHFDLRLTLCTNRVPAVEALLGSLRRDGIDAQFVEWAEVECANLQARAHVVLLPTNLTGFSLSKTHNRCSDALARFSLVLASPHGPYRDLGGAVFLQEDELVNCLLETAGQAARLRELTASSLASLATWADIELSADRLYRALPTLAPATRKSEIDVIQRILVVARANVATVKLSRTLGYFSAGLLSGKTNANFDFSLTTTDQREKPGLASLVMNERAWMATLKVVANNLRLEIAEGDVNLVCRYDGWHFVLNKAERTCAVMSGPNAELSSALSTIRFLSPSSPHASDRWHDAMISLLVQVLQRLGFDGLDFAADEGGGWAGFAEHGDPVLAASERRLAALWERFRGHEMQWGEDAEAISV